MGDAVALGAELQLVDGVGRERGRALLEQPHARAGVGKFAANVERVGVELRAVSQSAVGARNE